MKGTRRGAQPAARRIGSPAASICSITESDARMYSDQQNCGQKFASSKDKAHNSAMPGRNGRHAKQEEMLCKETFE